MMTYKVRDQFSGLRDFTLGLSQSFDETGELIHNGRNVIKKIEIKEGAFVVKHFKGMYFFNRLAYSLFRKSKAARSFIFSQRLNEQGISTPPAVAYVDYYTSGLLAKSYFISVFWSHKTLEQTLRHYNLDGPAGKVSLEKVSLLNNLAAFAHKLHGLGIYHVDFSLGNILVIETPDGYQFALVDLNRIKFGKVNYQKGLQNFNTLHTQSEEMNILIREYARLSGQPAEQSVERFWKQHDRTWYFKRLRRRIRRYTLSKVEKILDYKIS